MGLSVQLIGGGGPKDSPTFYNRTLSRAAGQFVFWNGPQGSVTPAPEVFQMIFDISSGPIPVSTDGLKYLKHVAAPLRRLRYQPLRNQITANDNIVRGEFGRDAKANRENLALAA